MATAHVGETSWGLSPSVRGAGVRFRREDLEEDEMSDALLIPIAAVATGVVVIVVAIAVVLVVLFVTLSMRGRQKRAARAERDRDIAQEQASRRSDPEG
jgi:hypothetical protein